MRNMEFISDSFPWQSSNYAYHRTSKNNIKSIRRNGIKPSHSTGVDTESICSVVQNHFTTYPFPFDRSEVVYCHLNGEWVKKCVEKKSDLTDGDVYFAIKLTKIQSEMYLADMRYVSDLLDYYHAQDSSVMMDSNSPDEAVQNYAESIVSINSVDDIESYDPDEKEFTELVINGVVPPESIVESL